MKLFKGDHLLTVTAASKGPGTNGQGRAGHLAILVNLRHAVFGAEMEKGFPAPSHPPALSPQLWASLCFLGTQVAVPEPFHLTEHLVTTVSLTSASNLSLHGAQMRTQGNQILQHRCQ